MVKVKGAARGARVGAITVALFFSACTFVGTWGWNGGEGALLWMGLPFHVYGAVVVVRSWFLGVWVGEGEVRVVSWLRVRRFAMGDVKSVELQHYYGAGGIGVGWIPFVGSIRMIEVNVPDRFAIWLPSTIGRRKRVFGLAETMRKALGLSTQYQHVGRAGDGIGIRRALRAANQSARRD